AAYNRMLERVKSAIDHAEKDTLPRIHDRIEDAKEKAVELGELTQEEAQKIGDYLRRDLGDAAKFMTRTGSELHEWLSFDIELIEDRLRGLFEQMVDQTRMELDKLAMNAWKSEHLNTGEITAMGTLRCTSCGKEMRFQGTGHIPPCPKCHNTSFSRIAE
ncbi:MAG: zinc ribbon-containing protein, partial [Gammaproteobacteria bacterium]|nr:zinc ribbon-containing protein [Gammaproteobacteria bacterium]